MVGLDRDKVILEPYNEEWAKEYEKEKIYLNHSSVHLKLIQHCKLILFQLKILNNLLEFSNLTQEEKI